MKEKVEAILDKIRPMLMMDGGNIELVDVKDNEVFVHLVGACGMRPSSTMTMQKALAIASNNIDVILATKRALHQDRCQSKNEDQSQIIESYLRLG